jgi:hypothetical protein
MILAIDPAADAASVNHPLGNRVEQGPRTLEHGRVAARHHQKFARLRTFHAA